MKKSGILHSDLAAIVAGMGHGDKLVICDSGYPIPHDKPVADVILTIGVPGLIQTLQVVLQELHIEGAMVAKEAEQKSPAMLKQIEAAIGTVPLKKITHDKFKEFCRTEPNVSFVRTGEATPFSNVILIAGVIF
jgi:D-ribose pyranase